MVVYPSAPFPVNKRLQRLAAVRQEFEQKCASLRWPASEAPQFGQRRFGLVIGRSSHYLGDCQLCCLLQPVLQLAHRVQPQAATSDCLKLVTYVVVEIIDTYAEGAVGAERKKPPPRLLLTPALTLRFTDLLGAGAFESVVPLALVLI